MEWTELNDLNLYDKGFSGWTFPYRSKERGDLRNEIAANLNTSDHPKFKVSRRSVRDGLTLLQQSTKQKWEWRKLPLG